MTGPVLLLGLACSNRQPAAPPACGPQPEPPGQRRVELRLVMGAGVSEQAVRARVGELARQVGPLGIEVDVLGPVERIDAVAVVGGGPVLPGGLATEAGEERQELARQVFAPALALLGERWRPDAAEEIDLVITEHLVAPDSPVQADFAGLSALTLAPGLEAGEGFDLGAILPAEYHPTMLVPWEHLGEERAAAVDSLLAHELGHALGLVHVAERDNLMGPRRWSSCRPVLTPAQLEQVHREG